MASKGNEVKISDIAQEPDFVHNPLALRCLDIFDSNKDGSLTYHELFSMLSTLPRLSDPKTRAECESGPAMPSYASLLHFGAS